MSIVEIGARLKGLRETAGYRENQVSEFLNLSTEELIEIENGKKDFNYEVLTKLSHLYNCPRDYIMRGGDFKYKTMNIPASDILDLNIIAKMNGVKRYSNLLKTVNKNSTDLTDYNNITSTKELREKWNVNSNDPIDIFSVVKENIANLTILWFPMPNTVSGCYFKENNSFFIFINSKHTKGRQYFTLAHELYHLLFDKERFFLCGINQNSESEKKADEFASQLLLPSAGLNNYMKNKNIANWTMEDIIDCEQYYRISHQAMLYRLKAENLISSKQYTIYRKNVKQEAKKLGFSTSLYEPNENDKEYYAIGELIPENEKALKNHNISRGFYRELLAYINRLDIVYNTNEEDIIE